MLKTIKVKEETLPRIQKVQSRENHHSLDDTVNYLVSTDKQIKKSGATIEQLIEAYNASKK